MASIPGVLEQITHDLEPYLPEQSIRNACQQVGYRYRHRQFDPVATVHLFVLQILCFNTALTHLRHLARTPMTAAVQVQRGLVVFYRQDVVAFLLNDLLRDRTLAAHRINAHRRAGNRWYLADLI